MKRPENNKWLDDALGEVIGSEKSEANFEKWQEAHLEAVEMLTSRAPLEVGPSGEVTDSRSSFLTGRTGQKNLATKRPLDMWRIIMKSKSPFTKLAVAAVVAIACLIGLSLWTGTGTGIALAEVLDRIEQVKAYMYRMSMTVDDKPVSQATILTSQEHGAKINIKVYHPITGQSILLQEMYILPHKKTMTYILPNEKKYSQIEYDETSLERMQKEFNDPGLMVRQILECEHTSLGKSTIDGIDVEGFQTTDPSFADEIFSQVDVKIWVDVETRFPVRLEMDTNKEDKMNNMHAVHAVVYDFQWDISVDSAEFEPVIPDDYTPGQPMMMLVPGKKPVVNEEAE